MSNNSKPFQQLSSRPVNHPVVERRNAPVAPRRNAAAYTDGSCIGNPGVGGYGVAVYKMVGNSLVNCFNVRGDEQKTTNNRMEMMAMITALEIARELGEPFDIYSDSTYTIKGLTEWMAGWKRKGWRTAGNKGDVVNRDLWERMDSVYEEVKSIVSIHKVKAHCGIAGNELADRLAQPRS